MSSSSSEEPSGPWADPDDVRRHLHLDDWDTTGITDEQIDYFIVDIANLLVEEELVDTGQSERRLRVIETLLAGHFLLDSGIDQLRQGEREGASDGSYTWFSGDFGASLRRTSLGQQAIAFDKSGRLAEIADEEHGEAEAGDWWAVTASREGIDDY